MNTREYAVELRKAADFLDSRPEFEVETGIYVSLDPARAHAGFYNKENFLQAAKALGNTTKKYTEGEYGKLELTSTESSFAINISRDKVCKKIVTYDCEALFSPEEVEAL